ncbi:MAG: MFS transporter [Terracidiphilus sp.]|jgi:predicted MFS family arabinose efflux permease
MRMFSVGQMGGFMLNKVLPHKRDRMILLPVIGSQLIVMTSMFLMPILIDTLEVHAGLSVKAAGLLLSMELAVSALTTLSLSSWVRPHSARRWALAGAFLAIAGTALTLISPALSLLFATRFLAGVGAGVVGAEATSVLSLGADRERLIAILTITSIVDAAFWLAVLPYLIDRFGYRAPYACLLLIYLCSTFLLLRLPSHSARQHSTGPALRAPFSFSALLVVIAVFLTQLGQGAFWSMEESYGSYAGFNSHAIGMILSASTLLLLLGAIGAACAGNRFGRFNALLIVIALNAFSILLVSTIAVHWVYLAANILQAVTNLSAVIYQLGLAARLDRGGRVIAVSTALVTLGNGIGPGLAASLSGVFGVPFIGVLVLGLNALALGLYCTVMLRGAKETKLSISMT